MDTKIKLTGLWKNTSKGGETYYGGNLTPNARILIFKNGFKAADKDPDLIVYLAPVDRQAQTDPKPENEPPQPPEDSPF